MFFVTKKTSSGFDAYVLYDNRTNTSVEVLPECGGIANSWIVQHNGKSFNLLLGYDSTADWRQNLTAKGFRSAKLSPFVCRLAGGRYSYNGQNYKMLNSFYLGENALHGLLHNVVFVVEDIYAGDECARLKLRYNYMGEDMGFPFKFSIIISYELHDKRRLRMKTKLINTEATAIPIVDGWHPYFNLQNKIDDCNLEMKTTAIVEMDEALLPTGNKVPFSGLENKQAILGRHFDDCYLLDPNADQPKCTLSNPANGLSIEIEPDANYKFMQLYTPEDRQSIAVECLTGAPDAFNNNLGLLHLPMGGEVRFAVDYVAKFED